MKVLFIIDSLGVGGAERSTFDYCVYLKQQHVEVKIICLRKRSEGVQQEAFQSGFDVYFLKSKNLLGHLREINNVFNGFQPSIVHTTLFKSRLRGRLHKFLFRKKHVLLESLVTLPFSEERIHQRQQGKLKIIAHKLFDLTLSNMVTHTIAISQQVKWHALKELYLAREENFSVIYRGRRLNSYLDSKDVLRQHYAQELSYPTNAIVYIHIGRQDFPKNHTFLIKSFLKFLDTIPYQRDRILICVGRTGDMSENITAMLSNQPMSRNIRFLGHRYDVEKLLAQSDVFLFPSLFEGLGGSIIEAKAAKLPLIVSDIPVFRELLAENTEAIFVDIKKDDQFVAAMNLLGTDASLRMKMGHKNLESFQKKFALEGVNAQILSLYQRFLNENTSTRK